MGWNNSLPTVENAQNGRTVLTTNLMADCKSGTLISYLHLMVTIALFLACFGNVYLNTDGE